MTSIDHASWRLAAAALFCAAVTLVSAEVVTAQLPEISETVEVRVFNFEVVVSDANNMPVRGLSLEDFELLVDGRPTPIDYFSAIEDGVSRELEEPAKIVADSGNQAELDSGDSRPFLVIVLDGREVDSGWIGRTLGDVETALGELIAATRGVMVVRQGISLETEQVFTSDYSLVSAALARAGSRHTTTLEVGDRNLLIRRLETAPRPMPGMSALELLPIQAQARSFLQEIRSQQRLQSYDLERSTAQLSALIRSLAAVPGRKEVLYLGRGFRSQTTEPLFRLWRSKYSLLALTGGVSSLQRETRTEGVERKLLSVIEEANRDQITFNTFSPRGLRSSGSNILFSTVETADVVDTENDRRREFILTLARSTGGVGRIQSSNATSLLTEMISGFRVFYSLGFQSPGESDGRRRVRVKVGGGYKVRHLDRYTETGGEITLEDLTLTALVTELADNPLGVSIDIDQAERQKDGTFVVPVVIKVPISRLALMPKSKSHVGRMQLVIQAQSAAGRLSPPSRGEVPIEIANSELLSAMGQMAGYRTRMRVAAGEQKIAVAVRDEIGGVDSTLHVIIEPGEDS